MYNNSSTDNGEINTKFAQDSPKPAFSPEMDNKIDQSHTSLLKESYQFLSENISIIIIYSKTVTANRIILVNFCC